MLLRLVILGLMVVGLIFGYRKWRGPPLLRVPFIWKSVARRHADVAEALRLRTACVEYGKFRWMLEPPPPRYHEQREASRARYHEQREDSGPPPAVHLSHPCGPQCTPPAARFPRQERIRSPEHSCNRD